MAIHSQQWNFILSLPRKYKHRAASGVGMLSIQSAQNPQFFRMEDFGKDIKKPTNFLKLLMVAWKH